MLSVFLVVIPIFALIFAGWATRRAGVFGPQATGELNRFVVYLALPALLFDIVADAHWREIWQPAFIAVFGLGATLPFVLTIALRWRRARPLADATIDALNAAYPNTGFMGFALATAALGPAALPPALIATIMTVCVVFAAALVLLDVALQADRHPRRLAVKVAGSLARNPLILAPALGAVVLALGTGLPQPVETFLKLLGGAASPCALVALGLFLAEPREAGEGTIGPVALLVAMKLLVQPLATWLLATRVFHLSPLLAHAAVLLAALPTGTGPFMVAEFYRREAGITARVVLISTIVSLGTITAYLALIR